MVLAAVSLLCLAADETKPACNARTLGRLWPEAANHDSKLRKKMARCGELELCTHGIWRYRWESLTVRLDQLPGGAKLPKPAACEASSEVAIEPSSNTEPATSRTR